MKLRNLLQGTPLFRILKWLQFIDTVQDVLAQLRLEKAERIKNKVDLDIANIEDVVDFIKSVGYTLPSFKGYTESEIYIRMRAKSLFKEIKKKFSFDAMLSIYRSFNIYGDWHNIRKVSNFSYVTDAYTLAIGEAEQYLDQESDFVEYYIGGLPVPNPPPVSTAPAITLDMEDEIIDDFYKFLYLDRSEYVAQTSHIMLRYRWILAENSTQLWTEETASAFYESTSVQHRRKVVQYRYQPWIPVELNSDNTRSIWNYPLYNDYSTYAVQEQILITGDLSQVASVKLGNGRHTIVDLSLIDVSNELNSYSLTSMYVEVQDAVTFKAEIQYAEFDSLIDSFSNKILTISEIGLFDVTNTLVAYVTFPEINFDSRMLTSFYFDFIII